jgi:signal peptidase I
MFAPKWKKEAKLLYKGAKKYIHYKRDLLKPDRIDEIESRRADLLEAIKADDKERTEEASKQLRNTCEKALPNFPQQSAWEENVEVIFVALVVALGLRAYVVQPFRIPTNSMQPTLNGINITEEEGYKAPWFGKQALDFVLRGRSHKKIVAKNDCHVVGLKDKSWFLFTRTEVAFSDGTRVKIAAPDGEVGRALREAGERDSVTGQTSFKRGETILDGTIDAGDLVLVDKVSYHFRKPKRGEVFVFDTRGIATGGRNTGNLSDQAAGTHYIKRLCGVPGDTLSIQPPNLWVNDKIAQEPGIQRVIRSEGAYYRLNPHGYQLADPRSSATHPVPLLRPGQKFHLKDEAPPGMREYAALGDNTGNSLDSRYWGSVKEFNLAGPALFSLWPITSGHWGFIR